MDPLSGLGPVSSFSSEVWVLLSHEVHVVDHHSDGWRSLSEKAWAFLGGGIWGQVLVFASSAPPTSPASLLSKVVNLEPAEAPQQRPQAFQRQAPRA